MVRLTDLLWAAKKIPSYMKVNRHFRYTMSRPGTLQSQLANLPGKDRLKVLVEPIRNWMYYKGDLVEILIGKDKGKQGTVIDIMKERNWVIVEGLNCMRSHSLSMEKVKQQLHTLCDVAGLGGLEIDSRKIEFETSQSCSEYLLLNMKHYRRIGKSPSYKGTYIASEGPLLHNQVKLVDPSDNAAAEVDFRYTEDGEKVRVSRRTGRIIPIPAEARDRTKEIYEEQPKDTIEKELCAKTFKPSLKTVEEDLMEAYNIVDTGVKPKTYWY